MLTLIWAIAKCTLLYQLHEPLEDDPLHLLSQVLEYPHLTISRPGFFNSLVFLLIVSFFLCWLICSQAIPRERIPPEMWEKCVKFLNQREVLFPGFMNVLNTMLEHGEHRVEQVVEENPKELEQFIFNEEELQMLLNTNFVNNENFVQNIEFINK